MEEEGGFSMNGGDGAYSYTKNSQFQKNASDSVKGMIHEAVIDYLDTQILTTTVRIADLGCSVGPNTFFAVENLIQAMKDKFCDSKTDLEFHVLFNDHSSNDFNTLFASLPPERQYHAAGVPGSFYGRLFPRASITLAHSSYALQWLSQQPQGVPNEGRIHYSGEGLLATEGRFRSLKFLALYSCRDLRVWTTESSHFPCLEQLLLDEVDELKEIPLDFAEISTLRVIKVKYCSDSAVESAKRIVEEQEELYGEESALRVQAKLWRENEALKSLSSPNFRVTWKQN